MSRCKFERSKKSSCCEGRCIMANTDLTTSAEYYLNALKVKWMQLQETPTIFAYVLNIKMTKFLTGRHKIYVELNPERSLLRRKPQTITSLRPIFSPKEFNFNKVNPLEVMMTIPFENAETQLIINRSPITKYHTLMCPQLENNLVQRLTSYGLRFVITFLQHCKDVDARIGYNSPGALASVNHLHFHLIHKTVNFYIDQADLKKLADDYIYRLDEKWPTEAICFIIKNDEPSNIVNEKVAKIFTLTEWLCARDIPHNLYIAFDRQDGKHKNSLKIFVFARSKYTENKTLCDFNLGFCEQAGYITVAGEKAMQELTETEVIERIRDETGDIYNIIYDYIKNKI